MGHMLGEADVGSRVGGMLLLNSNTLGVNRTKRFSCSNSRTLGTLGRRKVRAILVGPGVTAIRADRKITSRVCFLPIAPCFMRGIVRGRHPSNILLSFNKRATLGYKITLCGTNVFRGCGIHILNAPIRTVVSARSHRLFMRGLGRVGIGAVGDRTIRGLRSTHHTTGRLNCPIVVHTTCTLNNLNSNFYSGRRRLGILTRGTFSFSPRMLIRGDLGN